jgi:ribonuclease G
MSKEIYVNVTSYETRIAINKDGLLSDIYIEREEDRGGAGNIYKGKVAKVLPGMQSAFVNIGLERDAFLYVSDVFDVASQFDAELDAAAEERDDGNGKDAEEEGGGKKKASKKASAKGRGRHGRSRRRPRRKPDRSIEELLKQGQEVIVQVNREPLGTKGARITSHITIPGKFLVLMPTAPHLGISKKIDDMKERRRLRGILRDLRKAHNGLGIICRTAGAKKSRQEIRTEFEGLVGRWEQMREKIESTKAPALLHASLSTGLRVLREHLDDSVKHVLVDDEDAYDNCREFVQREQPKLLDRIKLYTDNAPMFEKHGLEQEIEKALRARVWLKSGGYLVINTMEAMTAIDVNTGKYTGRKDVEATILKTNLEAVKEIGRQIRLRDLGGIVVIDFIDMAERGSRKQVVKNLEQELRQDRARYTMLPMSEFSLVEITRQRLKKSLDRALCQPCPYCDGQGRIRNYYTLASQLERDLQKLAGQVKGADLHVRVHPDLAELLHERFYLLQDMEEELECRITLTTDASLHREKFDIVVS